MLDRRGARPAVMLGTALGARRLRAVGEQAHGLRACGASGRSSCIAGAGIGLLLGPASTDAVNRAIGASYGEVTGITQTIRNYASSVGLAVLGTLLTMTFASRLTSTLQGVGVPPSAAASAAQQAASGGSGSAGLSHAPPAIAQQVNAAIAGDFASATRAVFIGMAIALGICFVAALGYPRGAAPGEARRTAGSEGASARASL